MTELAFDARIAISSTSLALSEFVSAWRARAADLRRWAAAEGAACAWERAADELEASLFVASDALVSLEVASTESGYSSDHLRRLARGGGLPSTRRGRRLFFRRGDLPRKPTSVDAAAPVRYDPLADARRVAARRTRGA